MKDLKWLREQGEMMNRDEALLLSKLSIRESVKDFMMLYQMLQPQFEQTELQFRKERAEYLAGLQRQLKRHGTWEKKQRDRPFHKRRKITKTSR